MLYSMDLIGFELALLRSSDAYSKIRDKTGNRIIRNIVKPFIFLFYMCMSIPVFLRLRITVPAVSLFITSRCSLRCKDCSNMIPSYETPSDTTLDELKTYTLNVLEGVDALYRASIVGGEPFLFDDLGKLVDFLTSQKKIRSVKIFTNGTLLPKAEWLSPFKNKKAFVFVSNYEHSSKFNECIKILNENGVKTYAADKEQKWIDMGGIYDRGYTYSQAKKLFRSCPMRVCKLLAKGSLYVCGRSTAADSLGFIPCSNSDKTVEKVDLTKSDPPRIRREIRKLFKVKTLTACNYCNGGSNYILPATQCSKKDAREPFGNQKEIPN